MHKLPIIAPRYNSQIRHANKHNKNVTLLH